MRSLICPSVTHCKSNHCTRYDHAPACNANVCSSVSYVRHRLTGAIARLRWFKQEACHSATSYHLFSDHERHIQAKVLKAHQLAARGHCGDIFLILTDSGAGCFPRKVLSQHELGALSELIPFPPILAFFVLNFRGLSSKTPNLLSL